ncbi:MAG: polymer-forming cytoskeletal protein [Desulfobacteraceae bacterium]
MAKKTPISFVAQGTHLMGDIQSDARIVVEGSVEGNVRCTDMTIAPTGRVIGDLQVATLAVAGTYKGNLVAHRMVTIHATGAVEGGLFTRTLVVEEGGRMNGDIKVATSMEEFPDEVP